MHQSAEDRRQHEEMGWHAGWEASFDLLVEGTRAEPEGDHSTRYSDR